MINMIGDFYTTSNAKEYNRKSQDIAKTIDEYLVLFKGELSLDDILHKMSYRQLRLLWDTRVSRLEKERNAEIKAQQEAESRRTRKSILNK